MVARWSVARLFRSLVVAAAALRVENAAAQNTTDTVSTTSYTTSSYYEVDPNFPDCTGGVPPHFGDGDCDDYNNNEACGFDGGDCCECTCKDAAFDCDDEYHGGFFCVDPQSGCVDPSLEALSGCSGTLPYVGDGHCDEDNNNEECGYDGGDCCECTCAEPSSSYGCGALFGFNCLDPASGCEGSASPPSLLPYDDSDTGTNCIFAGDGDCDIENNNEACDFDGGDCCPCTCEDTTMFECGQDYHGGYFCVDPNSGCQDSSLDGLSSCTGIPSFVGDGDCDMGNNNEECGYDGGDCCECTCVDAGYNCGGVDGFACLDPAAPCQQDFSVASSLAGVAVVRIITVALACVALLI